MREKQKTIDIILQEAWLYPVYQPIVCLQSGVVLAYEALTRVEKSVNEKSTIIEVFELAKETNKLGLLERICHQKALEQAQHKLKGVKLFLNIDPDSITDLHVTLGLTPEQIAQYGLNPSDIVLELSEQTPIHNPDKFHLCIQTYKNQHFKFAVDDFGVGHSGFSRIQSTGPAYIKIDMAIIRDIDKDRIKQALVESLVHLSCQIEVELIAEGVESEQELKKLIELGVHYAQGYYIQRPKPNFQPICSDVQHRIIKANQRLKTAMNLGKIQGLAQPHITVSPEEKAESIYARFRENNEISEYCIVQKDQEVVGVITRKKILELFSGQYGYNLHAKKPIFEVMETTFLSVDAATTIEEVAKRAMSRTAEHVYDAVIVTQKQKYLGVVTIQTLLATTVEFQIRQAKEANPLTQMPGNNEIKRQIRNHIANEEKFAIMYFDLDAFKAYNDIYGFESGDQMIRLLAKSILNHQEPEWFSGHVGGDDFVVIGEPSQVKTFCQNVFAQFDHEKQQLYNLNDWRRGYIYTKNRHGKAEAFSLTTISVAVITNESACFQEQSQTVQSVSEHLTHIKKQSKQKSGNSLVIH